MHPDQAISKMASVYGSSLSGQQTVPGPGEDPLAARIGHLDAGAQATIRELSELQANHPVRIYESEDGLRAGLICGPSLRATHPEIVKRCSRLFFSIHHESICTIFESELRQQGRRHGK